MNIEEIIQGFKSMSFRDNMKVMSDLYEYHVMNIWGVKTGNTIQGFGWVEHDIEFSGVYIPLKQYSIGILNAELCHKDESRYNCNAIVSGVSYTHRMGCSEKISVEGEIPANMLIERSDDEQIIFCGMQQEGLRHGLGVEFIFEEELIKQRRGIWQNGVMTHLWNDDKFIVL